MAQLWKYITELNTTQESYEESDQIVINQGGRSVQIPWAILKAGIENKLTNIDNLLDSAVFTGEDEEEGYLEADITLDVMKQEIITLRETIVNLSNAIEHISSAITVINQNINATNYTVKEQGNAITLLNNKLDTMPRFMTGTVNPNTIIEELNPRENDIYVLANPNSPL